MQSFTFAATFSGLSAKPFKKSAFTGRDVASTISRMCASISSRGTQPSGLPREKAEPAEVVASALNPSCSKYIAVPISHGFGSTKQPDSCIVRNFEAARFCVDLIRQDYAAQVRTRSLTFVYVKRQRRCLIQAWEHRPGI